jgi:1-deoxy-D-xylulose-5-phosphate synthase
MSISRNVGALSLYLGKARMSKPYTFTRDTLEGGLRCFGRAGRILVSAGEQAKGSFKKLFVPGMFFEDMGIRYIGPINGHNIGMLAQAIRAASEAPGPVIIHAVTKKGRGFEPAERQPDVFHGVGAYDPDTGEAASSGRGADGKGRTYTQIFAEALVSEAGQNEDIVAITAAMEVGTGLSDFHKRFPGRFFDVGIAEEHAVALAAGLSLGGKLPVVAVYSTFLQRAFDQMMINVALQGQHVVFCLDRAGLVGEDGPTHNGAFDLAYLRSIPGMRIIAPSDSLTFRAALHTALRMEGGPVALRYPRDVAPDDIMSMLPGTLGSLEACAGAACAKSAAPLPPLQAGSVPADACAPASDAAALPVAKARLLTQGRDVAFLALGRLVGVALEAAALLAADGLSSSVYDMLWVKPLDEDAVRQASGSRLVVTLEEGTVKGGFGAAVLEAMAAQRLEDAQAPDQACVLTLGLPDDFVCHGGKEQLFSMLGLTAKDIAMKVTGILGGRAAS